ncbi:hypothetical protein ACFL3G_05840 [Planctomycetota bacterium]
MNITKPGKIITIKLTALFAVYIATTLLSGCYVYDLAKPEFPPYAKARNAGYHATVLKSSNAADVLNTIHLPKYELLSQSKNVIASTGEKKRKGFKKWFKMVAFDEQDLLAKRKYLFTEDERPKQLAVEPWEYLRFDCQVVLEQEILDEPYANENARRIEILKQILKDFRTDIADVKLDNDILNVSGLMVNQAIEAALLRLDQSPAIAAKLSDEGGIKFSHIILNKGKVRLVIDGDIATVKLRAGSAVTKKFKKEM